MMQTHSRKGQSAIEYLTTYGWALLAIIIVGAVLVNMGVFSQCQQTTPRFSGQNVAVDSWGFQDASTISMTVQAISQGVNITDVTLDFDGDGTSDVDSISGNTSISAGGTGTITVNLAADTLSSGACANADLSFTYDIDGGADGLQATGSGTLGGPVP